MKWYQVSYIENRDFVTDYVLAKSKKHVLSLYKEAYEQEYKLK